jgi:ribosome biogenesis SPOUT family RNA methylase Rps3
MPFTFIVEHLDPELEKWSTLEYKSIATECHRVGSRFILSSVSPQLVLPEPLQGLEGLEVEQRSVEELYADQKETVCLLDPAAKQELSPDDGQKFSVFLFGGILGISTRSDAPILC